MERSDSSEVSSKVFVSSDTITDKFTIHINRLEGNVYTIKVTLNVGAAVESHSNVYQVNISEHTSCINAFSKLGRDFHLRVPQNSHAENSSSQAIPYHEVLLDNLDSGMLYGYGDPAIIRTRLNDGNLYYLVSTSNDAPDAFPILRSEDLKRWAFSGYVFPQGQKPSWAAEGENVSDYWAPELHEVGNEYRVYFVARDKYSRELCIGMARSLNPEGPFTSHDSPILKGNVIDPHIYVQDADTSYLFWKEDNNDVWPAALLALLLKAPYLITSLFPDDLDRRTACFMVTLWPWLQTLEPMQRFLMVQIFIEAVTSRFTEIYNLLQQIAEQSSNSIMEEVDSVLRYMKTPLFAQQLSPDGRTLIGERTKVLENDLKWEAHLVEGMWISKQSNKYYMFYAGNDFSTSQYGIGVAVADALLGPYHKMDEPFLQSTDKWTAPGHPSVTTTPDGKPVMFLHAYFPGKAGYKQFRALLSIKLSFVNRKVTWEK